MEEKNKGKSHYCEKCPLFYDQYLVGKMHL